MDWRLLPSVAWGRRVFRNLAAPFGIHDAKPAVGGSPSLLAGGFILQMSNPKALVFFSALLPQFVNPRAPVWPQVAILAATSVVIESVVQVFYASIAGRATAFATKPRFVRITNRVSGSLLVAAGLGMAAVRRA